MLIKFTYTRTIYLLTFLFSLVATSSFSQTKKSFTLVVDAGHGGYDPGTLGNKKYKKTEKDVALIIALKFGKLVEKNLKDVKVVYTRKTDVFIKLVDRPKIANRNNADLFISIHCNANNSSKINGSETYVLGTHKNKDNLNVAKKENSVIFLEDDYSVTYEGFDPNDVGSVIGMTLGQEQYFENSLLLASLVQNNFKKHTALRSRGVNGVKQAGFWVLARNYMPSILVETGFLSNDKDAKVLMSVKGQNQVANALFLAFKEYKQFWDEQTGMSNNYANVDVSENIVAVTETKKETHKPPVQKEEPKKVVTKPKTTTTKVPEVKKKETTKIVTASKTKPIPSKKVIPKVAPKKVVTKKTDKIEFAIQLMSSQRKVSTSDRSFKGLPSVSYYKSGTTYKYVFNRSTDYNKVLSSQSIVKRKGFKGTFVVAFKNGQRISLSKALKETNRK